MSFLMRLFGGKKPPEELTEEQLIALLQGGKMGKQCHLVMRCYDERNRTPADRKKTLTEDAYPAMLRLCDYNHLTALLTSPTEVILGTKDNAGDAIFMHMRFARGSDLPRFISECNKILRQHGFRA